MFDSGIGGLSVLRALRAGLPDERWVYFADAAHAPYGERDEDTVRDRTLAIAAELRAVHGIKALVVACNTATAAGVHALRAAHPDLPVIGLEPALKPALARTRTGHVAVLATRATLTSARFAGLRARAPVDVRITLQPCDGLAAAIEADDARTIVALCRRYTVEAARYGTQAGEIDTVVLGCTHYPLAADVLRELLGPQVTLLDTAEPVARQTLRLLRGACLLAPRMGDHLLDSRLRGNDEVTPVVPAQAGTQEVTWRSSGPLAPLLQAAARWLPAGAA